MNVLDVFLAVIVIALIVVIVRSDNAAKRRVDGLESSVHDLAKMVVEDTDEKAIELKSQMKSVIFRKKDFVCASLDVDEREKTIYLTIVIADDRKSVFEFPLSRSEEAEDMFDHILSYFS